MPYVELSGKNIYYEEYGAEKSPAVVYLHGGPGESCLTYSYQAKKLGEYFHIISFDQYGVFRSDALEENTALTVKDLVDMTEQLRLSLDIKKLDTPGTLLRRYACPCLCSYLPRQC